MQRIHNSHVYDMADNVKQENFELPFWQHLYSPKRSNEWDNDPHSLRDGKMMDVIDYYVYMLSNV